MSLLNHARLACLVGGVALMTGEAAEQQAIPQTHLAPDADFAASFPEVAARDQNTVATDLLIPTRTTTGQKVDIASELAQEGALPISDGEVVASDCTVTLDLVPQSGAMIGLSLLAPCNPDSRIVISHAGLAITGRTTATGSHFSSLTAMEVDAKVMVRLDSGESIEASIPIPEVADLRRVAVQWQGEDAFQINAFKGDSDYFEPGHLSALRPGSVMDEEFVAVLGDPSADLPLLAEVFTAPSTSQTEVLIQAETSAATCAREIYGEVVKSDAGSVDVSELVLAMPDCSAIGDIVVLKNLVSELKLAAAK